MVGGVSAETYYYQDSLSGWTDTQNAENVNSPVLNGSNAARTYWSDSSTEGWMHYPLSSTKKINKFTFYIRFDDYDKAYQVRLMDSNDNVGAGVFLDSSDDGDDSTAPEVVENHYNAPDGTTIANTYKDTWYKIEFENIDYSAHTFDVYVYEVGSGLVNSKTGLSFNSNVDSIKTIEVNNNANHQLSNLYIDTMYSVDANSVPSIDSIKTDKETVELGKQVNIKANVSNADKVELDITDPGGNKDVSQGTMSDDASIDEQYSYTFTVPDDHSSEGFFDVTVNATNTTSGISSQESSNSLFFGKKIFPQDFWEDGDYTTNPEWTVSQNNADSISVQSNTAAAGTQALEFDGQSSSSTSVLKIDRGINISERQNSYTSYLRTNSSNANALVDVFDDGNSEIEAIRFGLDTDSGKKEIRINVFDDGQAPLEAEASLGSWQTNTWYRVQATYYPNKENATIEAWHLNGTKIGKEEVFANTADGIEDGLFNVRLLSSAESGTATNYYDNTSYAETTVQKPDINSLSTVPVTWEKDDSIDVDVDASDSDGSINSVDAKVFEEGTKIVDTQLTNTGGTTWEKDDLFTADESVSYTLKVTATDDEGYTSTKSETQLIEYEPSISLGSPADGATLDLGDDITFDVEATGETGSVDISVNGTVLSLPKNTRGTSNLVKSQTQGTTGKHFWRAYTAFNTSFFDGAEDGTTNGWSATSEWSTTQKETINGSYSFNATPTADAAPEHSFSTNKNQSISWRMRYASYTDLGDLEYTRLGLYQSNTVSTNKFLDIEITGEKNTDGVGGALNISNETSGIPDKQLKGSGWFNPEKDYFFKAIPDYKNGETTLYVNHEKVGTVQTKGIQPGLSNVQIITSSGQFSDGAESVLFDDFKVADTAVSSNFREFKVVKDPDLVTYDPKFPKKSPPLDWTFLTGKATNATYNYMITGNTGNKGWVLYQERESTASSWTTMTNESVNSLGTFTEPRDRQVLSENESYTYNVPYAAASYSTEHTVKVEDILTPDAVQLTVDGVDYGRVEEGETYFVRDTDFQRTHFNSLIENIDFEGDEVTIAIDSPNTKRIANSIGYYDYKTSFYMGSAWYNSTRTRVAVGQLPVFKYPSPTGKIEVPPNEAGYFNELNIETTVRGIGANDVTFYYRKPNGTVKTSTNVGDINKNSIVNISSDLNDFSDTGTYEWWVEFQDTETSSTHESWEYSFTVNEDTEDVEQVFNDSVDTTGDGSHDTDVTVYYDPIQPEGTYYLSNFTSGTVHFTYSLGITNVKPDKRLVVKDSDGNIVYNKVYDASKVNFDFLLTGSTLSTGEWKSGQYSYYTVLDGDNYNLKTKTKTFSVETKKSGVEQIIQDVWVAGFWGKYLDALAKYSQFTRSSWNFFFQVMFFLGLLFGVSWLGDLSIGTLITFTVGFILAAGSYLEPWLGGFFIVAPAIYLGVWIFQR